MLDEDRFEILDITVRPESQLAGKRFRVRARETQGAERERLWSDAKKRDDAFTEYEKRVARRIAVVVLERL